MAAPFVDRGGFISLDPKRAREPEHLVEVSPVDGGFWTKADVAVQTGRNEVQLQHALVVVPDTVAVGTYQIHIRYGAAERQVTEQAAANTAKIRLLVNLFARLPAPLRPRYQEVADQSCELLVAEATSHWFKTYNDLIQKTGQRDSGLQAEHNSFLVYDSHPSTTRRPASHA